MPSALSRRIVAGYRNAFEHSSEKERALYLRKHPQADPKRHTVKAPEGKAPQKPEAVQNPGKAKEEVPQAKKPGIVEKPEAKPGVPEKPEASHEVTKPEAKPEAAAKTEAKPGGGKSFLGGLSGKAKAFLGKTSESMKKFMIDPAVRAKAIESAKASMMKAPGKYAKQLVNVAKHEIHEFKEAGIAVGHVMRGKKLDDKQKKVVKQVAIHLGIAVTAAAFTSTGLMAGALALGKGLAIRVAVKAAKDSMSKLHTLNELSHVGHGIFHGISHIIEHAHEIFASEGVPPKAKDILTPEEAFTVLVMQSVFTQLEKLDDKTLTSVLESAAAKSV